MIKAKYSVVFIEHSGHLPFAIVADSVPKDTPDQRHDYIYSEGVGNAHSH